MAQFTLTWDNSNVLADSNVVSQKLFYRYKTIGGAFIAGADLSKDTKSVDSPILSDNRVIEFIIQCSCNENGPSNNDNGIQEEIEFACIVPTINKTYNQSTISLNLTGLDISKVKFTLKKSSDNSIVGTPVIVNVVNNTASMTNIGLTEVTNYYYQVELYANVNNVELKSSVCSPYPFQTNALPSCDPITSLTVASIEIF